MLVARRTPCRRPCVATGTPTTATHTCTQIPNSTFVLSPGSGPRTSGRRGRGPHPGRRGRTREVAAVHLSREQPYRLVIRPRHGRAWPLSLRCAARQRRRRSRQPPRGCWYRRTGPPESATHPTSPARVLPAASLRNSARLIWYPSHGSRSHHDQPQRVRKPGNGSDGRNTARCGAHVLQHRTTNHLLRSQREVDVLRSGGNGERRVRLPVILIIGQHGGAMRAIGARTAPLSVRRERADDRTLTSEPVCRSTGPPVGWLRSRRIRRGAGSRARGRCGPG